MRKPSMDPLVKRPLIHRLRIEGQMRGRKRNLSDTWAIKALQQLFAKTSKRWKKNWVCTKRPCSHFRSHRYHPRKEKANKKTFQRIYGRFRVDEIVQFFKKKCSLLGTAEEYVDACLE